MASNSLFAMNLGSFMFEAYLANGDDGTHASDFKVYIIEDERSPLEIRSAMASGTKISDLKVIFSTTASEYSAGYDKVYTNGSGYNGDDFKNIDFDLEKKYRIVYNYGNLYRVRNCPFYDWSDNLTIEDYSFSTVITGWFNPAHLPAKSSTPDFTFSVSKGVLTITPEDNNAKYKFAIYLYPNVTNDDLQYYAEEKTCKITSNPSYSVFKGVETIDLADYGLTEGEKYRVYAYRVIWNDEDNMCYAGYVSSYPFTYSKTATAIETEEINTSTKPVKTIENGKIVIMKNGKKYDVSGREL